MSIRDLHTHTTYSDGTATPEQMVLAAIRLGLDEIGISDHSYTHFDQSYCMKRQAISAYTAEMARLKAKYSGQIVVRCGVEQDLYSTESTAPFEYAIGSVHYLMVGDRYYPIDDSKEATMRLCREGFGGDWYAMCRCYYGEVARFARREDIGMIGHLDLICKFNEGNCLFDEQDPRYLAAAKECVDVLAGADKTFEINTGAMAKGYRTSPYPAKAILTYLQDKGCALLAASDAHSPDTIAYGFDRLER